MEPCQPETESEQDHSMHPLIMMGIITVSVTYNCLIFVGTCCINLVCVFIFLRYMFYHGY